MVRTVKVRLELDRDDYKRGLRDAANDIRGFDGEVRTAGKDVDAMGVEVKAMGRDVQAAGREVDTAAKGTARLGGEAKTTRQNVVDLAKEIDKTKTSLKSMGEEFQRTGKVNVDELKKLSNALRDLERAKDLISKLTPGDGGKKEGGGGLLDFALDEWIAKLAKGTAAGIGAGIDAAVQFAKDNKVAAAIIGAIVVAAPAIGAAINAAMLLGVGGGALAAGIVAAAQDQRVSSAYKDLGANVVRDFETASAPLVEPLVKGASKLGGAFDKMLPAIQSGMAKLAPVVDHLVDGLIGFIAKIGPGFSAAFAAAIPLLDQVAADLPLLGQGIGDFLAMMAAGGPGAIAFFHDLIVLINIVLANFGGLVLALSTVYNVFSALAKIMSGDLTGAMQIWDQFGKKSKEAGKDGADGFKEFTDSLKKAGDEAARTSDLADQVGFAAQTAGLGARIAKVDFGVLSSAIADTGSTADMLAGKMTDRLMGTMLGMSHANLGVAESLNALKDTLSTTGLAIDRHTGQVSMSSKAGLQLRESVLGAVEANLRMYDAQIASGVGADVATAKYEANTQALHDQLIAAHFTEAQVSDLIGEYGRVPGRVNTAIATQGLTEAINNLNTLLRQLLGLPSYKRVTIDQVTIARRIDAGNPVGGGVRIQRWGGVTEHAETGLLRDASIYSAVSSGARYAFAEPQTGGEAFIPKSGDLERSRGIWSYVGQNWLGMGPMAGSGGGGGGSLNITITAAPGGTMVDQAMSSWFMSAVRQGQITLTTDQGSRVQVG